MLRLGASTWSLLLALGALGCSGLSSRPPSLEYTEPSVLLEVRFSEEPFAIAFSRARDESETVVAQCSAACRLQLPPGLYRLRAYGDAPAVQRVFWLRHHTRVFVDRGSNPIRSVGLGLEVSGALGLATLLVGAVSAPPGNTEPVGARAEHGVSNLAVIGGLGVGALAFGIILHQAARSHVEVSEVEDAPAASRLSPVLDARGAGFAF